MENTTEFPEKYFTILYKLIRKQNESLLMSIATNENLSYKHLCKRYLPSHTSLRTFMKDKVTTSHHHPNQVQTSP